MNDQPGREPRPYRTNHPAAPLNLPTTPAAVPIGTHAWVTYAAYTVADPAAMWVRRTVDLAPGHIVAVSPAVCTACGLEWAPTTAVAVCAGPAFESLDAAAAFLLSLADLPGWEAGDMLASATEADGPSWRRVYDAVLGAARAGTVPQLYAARVERARQLLERATR